MAYLVNEVAHWAQISVRTLHHYDRCGLLKPDQLSEAGYRLYSDQNLERLQEILFFKTLGFSLKQIQALVESPDYARLHALESQKEWLEKEKQRLDTLMETLDKSIEAIKKGNKMKKKALFKGLSLKEIKAHQAQYAQETEARWGQTEAYRESQKRTAGYTAEDWARIQAEQAEIYQRIVAGMEGRPESPEVQAAVADLRASFCRYYYDCTPEIFAGLGQMYMQDARFRDYYEKIQPGLAAFLSQAIACYSGTQA